MHTVPHIGALPFQAYDREIADGVAIMEPVPQNVSLESATTNLQRQSSFLEKFLSKLADWIVETIRLLRYAFHNHSIQPGDH